MQDYNSISKGILKAVGVMAAITIGGYLLYEVRLLIIYLLVSLVVSMIALPIVDFLKTRLKFPNILAVLSTLLLFVLLFAGFITLFVPLIITQGQNLSILDTAALEQKTVTLFGYVNSFFESYGINLQKVISEANITSKLDFNFIPAIVNSILGVISGLGMGVASVLFITFFFLKDKKMFTTILKRAIPDSQEEKILNPIDKINHLLGRYFLGLICQISILFVIYLVVLLIFGVQNAFIIAFITALLNIIPYIGPLIAMVMVIVLTMLGMLSPEMQGEMFSTTLYVAVGYTIAQVIDNNVTSPLIFSNSVKSHPLEIFMVVLAGGMLFGITGMIVAIPMYTILKIIAKEFYPNNPVVKILTKDL